MARVFLMLLLAVTTDAVRFELRNSNNTSLSARSCCKFGSFRSPLDMKGQGRTFAFSAEVCQKRCARATDCSYFSYFPDGGCHLADIRSVPMERALGSDTPCSGPVVCSASNPGSNDLCECNDLGSNWDNSWRCVNAPRKNGRCLGQERCVRFGLWEPPRRNKGYSGICELPFDMQTTTTTTPDARKVQIMTDWFRSPDGGHYFMEDTAEKMAKGHLTDNPDLDIPKMMRLTHWFQSIEGGHHVYAGTASNKALFELKNVPNLEVNKLHELTQFLQSPDGGRHIGVGVAGRRSLNELKKNPDLQMSKLRRLTAYFRSFDGGFMISGDDAINYALGHLTNDYGNYLNIAGVERDGIDRAVYDAKDAQRYAQYTSTTEMPPLVGKIACLCNNLGSAWDNSYRCPGHPERNGRCGNERRCVQCEQWPWSDDLSGVCVKPSI